MVKTSGISAEVHLPAGPELVQLAKCQAVSSSSTMSEDLPCTCMHIYIRLLLLASPQQAPLWHTDAQYHPARCYLGCHGTQSQLFQGIEFGDHLM